MSIPIIKTFAVYRRNDGRVVRYELVQKTEGRFHQQLLKVRGQLVQEPPPDQTFIKWESEIE